MVAEGSFSHKIDYGIQIALLVQKLRQYWRMGGIFFKFLLNFILFWFFS